MEDLQLHRDKQEITWSIPSPYVRKYGEKAEVIATFLKLVTTFNGINIGPREIDFLAYMILRDGLVSQLGRKLYREKFNLNKAVIYNIIKRLKRKGVLIGKGDQLRVHPKIVLNFKDDNFIFQFKCLKK